jgi:hypothetical protein
LGVCGVAEALLGMGEESDLLLWPSTILGRKVGATKPISSEAKRELVTLRKGSESTALIVLTARNNVLVRMLQSL